MGRIDRLNSVGEHFFYEYRAIVEEIPEISASEETELLARWDRFKDAKARERMIEGNMRIVPPIARKQHQRFGAHVSELIAEGNLALVESFDEFVKQRRNVRFPFYARTCVRNAVVRYAVSLLSPVHHAYGNFPKPALYLEPDMPDLVGSVDYDAGHTGCRRARPTTSTSSTETDVPEASNFGNMMPTPEWKPMSLPDNLPWILQARLTGKTLNDIAKTLNVSVATAHRKVNNAIEEIRHGNTNG